MQKARREERVEMGEKEKKEEEWFIANCMRQGVELEREEKKEKKERTFNLGTTMRKIEERIENKGLMKKARE